jgi:ABC-type glycerol-3-phosphate transport system substrate-binding protein
MEYGARRIRPWNAILFIAVLSACSSSPSNPAANPGKDAVAASTDIKEPVTLRVYPDVVVTDDDFNAEPIAKKYPNIKLEMIKKADNKLPDLVAAGNTPDIILGWQGTIATWRTMDLVDDITPFIKKHSIDLNRFESVVLDAIKVTSDKGELYGIPYGLNFNALYYNKDIFDKFGVPYPKDGMTWEDAIEVGRKVTREEGGVKYKGLSPEDVNRMSKQIAVNTVDPTTDKSLLNTEPWKRVFETTKAIYSIPGNEKDTVAPRVAFTQNKTVAMLGTVNIINTLGEATNQGLNWDVAQYPSYKGLPNTYGAVDGHWIIPVKTSKQKDAIMKVIEVVTSDEVQTISARQTGRLTPLKNGDIKKLVAADLPYTKGKNISGIFKSNPAVYPKQPLYVGNDLKHRNDAFNDYLAGAKDLNTVLREAEDKHNKDLQSEKANK